MEFLREQLSTKFDALENYYIVDSMPLEVAKLSRSGRSTICKEHYHTAPNKGFLRKSKYGLLWLQNTCCLLVKWRFQKL